MPVDFHAKQLEFTRYIRDPERHPVPADVKPERMAMYRQLVYNNIEDFLAGNFPVIRRILNDEQWGALVQDFIVSHRAKTPYFAEISEEFLAYLENERHNPDDFPFLLELAHYEWVELAISIAKEETVTRASSLEIRLDSNVRLSPLASLLLYRFPVHRIAPDCLPQEPPEQPTTLIAYRDVNDAVKFLEINAITYRLLEIIQEQEQKEEKGDVLAQLKQLASESQHPNPELIASGGLVTLQGLADKGIVLAC